MKNRIFFSLAVLFLQVFLINHQCLAQTDQQDTTSIYRVEMKDGNEFLGRILSQEDGIVKLKTETMGILSLKMLDIKAMTRYDANKVKDGKLWFDNPQATRYLFAPNAYGLKKGEGYYQNVWVFVSQASVGVTDAFSIGVGIIPLFLFGDSFSPVWLLPKVSVPVVKDKFNVGGGALIGTVLGEDEYSHSGNDESRSFGIAYGLTTFGSRDQNITLGLGYGYAGGDWASSPAITVSGILRTGNRGYIITENYYINTGGSGYGIISIGGRRIIKNIGLDFGLLRPIGSDDGFDFIGLPFLGLTVPFGRK